jgi:hypothetical protein
VLEKVVERERRRERLPANFGKPWSEAEDKALVAKFEAATPTQAIATKHQRTHSSVRLRLEKLGQIEPTSIA